MRKPYSILAVAITATACGGTVEPSSRQSSKQELADATNKPLAPTPNTETVAKPACDPKALSTDLSLLSLDDALTQHARFRCLCDDEGYPLVGNLNGKVVTTASEFCSALKKKDLL